MSRQALDCYVEVSPGETRAALVDDDGLLQEIQVERVGRESLVGGLYLGRVTRAEKGMSAVFVDIGTGEPGIINRVKGVAEGEKLIVQVVRDARDGKGPALSMKPTLLGRYLSYTPGRKGLNWARAIGKGGARASLESMLADVLDGMDGFSVRAPAASVDKQVLEAEKHDLLDRWAELEDAVNGNKAPLALQPAPALLDRLLRDADPEARFALDDRAAFLKAEKTVAARYPDLRSGLAFQKEGNLFEAGSIEEQLEEALSRTVMLKGGGSIAFDHTEAMTVVDVNMGAGTAQGDDAIFRINRLAAEEVARQVMLRNIAGLVVIDFISMKNRNRAKKLVETMRSAFKVDRRHTDILGLTAGGLMEITRQREGVALASLMLREEPARIGPDPMAQGCAILRAAMRLRGAGQPTAEASAPVIAALSGPLAPAMEELAGRLGRPLSLREGADQSPPQVEME